MRPSGRPSSSSSNPLIRSDGFENNSKLTDKYTMSIVPPKYGSDIAHTTTQVYSNAWFTVKHDDVVASTRDQMYASVFNVIISNPLLHRGMTFVGSLYGEPRRGGNSDGRGLREGPGDQAPTSSHCS